MLLRLLFLLMPSQPVDLDEHGLRHSSIEVELGNVREHPYEPATYRVDVLRFLNGFATKNEIILLLCDEQRDAASQLRSHHSEQTFTASCAIAGTSKTATSSK